MSNHAALTIIAISLSLLTIIVLAAVFILALLFRRILHFQHTVSKEITELRAEIHKALSQAQETSQRITKMFQDAGQTLRYVGMISGGLTHFVKRSPSTKNKGVKSSSLVKTGIKLAWSFYQRRKKAKPNKVPDPSRSGSHRELDR